MEQRSWDTIIAFVAVLSTFVVLGYFGFFTMGFDLLAAFGIYLDSGLRLISLGILFVLLWANGMQQMTEIRADETQAYGDNQEEGEQEQTSESEDSEDNEEDDVAIEALREEYARGNIDKEEFEKRKSFLQGSEGLVDDGSEMDEADESPKPASCPNCGKNLSEKDNNFCMKCGEELSQ